MHKNALIDPDYQPATASDARECVRIRGQTRENAVSEERLRALGITAESWAEDIRIGALPGFVCKLGNRMAGYCFGAALTGEIVVLVVLPEFEGQGIARQLLALVVKHLRGLGHKRLFLGCSANPAVRSYGFFRHLGWRSTGTVDALGDEVLELFAQ